MDFFDEHKALIITVLLFSLLLLTMYNINISNANKKVRETLIELSNIRAAEELQEEEQQEEPEPPQEQVQQPNLQTHQAFNQNQEETRQNVQSRLEEIFQRNSAMQEASEEESSESTSGEFTVGPSRTEKRQEASQGNNSTEEVSTQQGSLRNSSISFSLVGRTAIFIPNPIYTCDVPGKIVVNITVDAAGRVTDTSVNKSASSSSNQCLIDRALEYAAGATFSALSGRNAQPGTITFYFQG